MPFSESHAKSLFREINSDLRTALKNRKYWDLTILRILLDKCDSVLYDDPRLGLEMTKIATQLALLVPKKDPEEWRFVDSAEKQEHRELLVRSFAVLGGAYRAVAKFDKANKAYKSAVGYAQRGKIRPIVRANLAKRLAKLRSAQGRFSDASKLVDSAVDVYQAAGDQVAYADALNTKGYVLYEANQFSESARYFGRALSLVKGSKRRSKLAQRTVATATQNLAAAVLEGCQYKDLIEVLPLVIKAKRYQSKCRNSVAKEKLAWVEARIHAKFGCGRLAERRLIAARKKLGALGAVFEAALVALELSVLYLEWREWPKLEELAIEAFEEFQALSSHTEAISALRLWVEGAKVRSLTKNSIRETQATIEKIIQQAGP